MSVARGNRRGRRIYPMPESSRKGCEQGVRWKAWRGSKPREAHLSTALINPLQIFFQFHDNRH